MMWFYRIYEKQAIEQDAAAEYQMSHKGQIPSAAELRRIVDKKLAKQRESERQIRKARNGG